MDRYKRIMDDIDQEIEPQTKLKKQVVIHLRGTLLGGMASSTAYFDFKKNFFDGLPSASEKERVKSVLVDILRSDENKLADKAKAAYACADIVVSSAIPEIEKLLIIVKKGSIAELEFNRALQALKQGKSISELIRENVQ